MIKEELEKEAEEKFKVNNKDKDREHFYDRMWFKTGYLAGAEPREEHIEELEQELTVEKDHLAEEVELHLHAEEYIKSLEKENAELKEKLKEKLKTIADKDLSFVAKFDALEKENAELKEKYSDNLSLKDEELMCLETEFNTYKSEAKELIEKYMLFCKGELTHYKDIEEQAEQFLKEIQDDQV